jgi:predicted TIM-barrel fold metal-dependent hydrolase
MASTAATTNVKNGRRMKRLSGRFASIDAVAYYSPVRPRRHAAAGRPAEGSGDGVSNERRIVAAALVLLAIAGVTPAAADGNIPNVPFAIDATRSDPARPTRPLGDRYRGPVFDTHAHMFVMHDPTVVIQAMEAAEVRRLVVLPTPNASHMPRGTTILSQMEELRKSSQGKVILMCGSDYLVNWMQRAAQGYYATEEIDRLTRDVKSGACAGIGEIGFRHYAKTSWQLVIDLPAGYPPLLAIAETAARLNVPLDLHAEPVTPGGDRRDAEVFGTIAAMFARNPTLKLVNSHTGMTNVRNARALLKAFPTLMMNVNFAKHASEVDWTNLEGVTDKDRLIYADWAALFEEMPDRFMLGTDFFFGRVGEAAKEYERRIRHARRALGSLDPAAARRIAYENAVHMFGGPPR